MIMQVDVIKMFVLPWSSWKEKHQSYFTATVASKFTRFKYGWLQRVWKRRCTKCTSLIQTTSNIASESERSGPSCVTSALLQLCVSGVAILQLVWWAVGILSTAFNYNIVFSVFAIRAAFEAFVELLNQTVDIPHLILLQLSVRTLF